MPTNSATPSRPAHASDVSTFDVVVAVNDDRVLESNLARSPAIASGRCRLIEKRGFPSATLAYASGLREATSEWVVFPHQDVYLPEPWFDQLALAIRALEDREPRAAAIAPCGVGRDDAIRGRAWLSGHRLEFRGDVDEPTEAVSFDELTLVLRQGMGVGFDPELPGYHLYGTDLAQSAWAKGHGAYLFNAPLIHNSRSVRQLGDDYVRAYEFMQKKYRSILPIKTCVVPITPSGRELRRWRRRARLRALKRHLLGERQPGDEMRVDSAEKARALGYEDLPPHAA